MVQTNIVEREVVLKIFYYGLPDAGKRTNLRLIAQKTPALRHGTVKEENGKEGICSLEYTAPESVQIANMKVKCQLFTISNETADKGILQEYFQGLDGVVFVTDSRASKERDNARALDQLEKNFKDNGYNGYEMALVFQWNKQDLKDIKSTDEWNSLLNERNVPAVKASAETGEGVQETLGAIIEEVRSKVEEHLKVPSKRLPKKKLGIGLGKKDDKAEESGVEETIRRNEIDTPAEKPFEEGKTKIKFNLPKLRPRTEEPPAAAHSSASEAKNVKESAKEPAFEEEEDILVSAKKSQPAAGARPEEPKREELKKPEEPKREELKKPEEPKREELKKPEEPKREELKKPEEPKREELKKPEELKREELKKPEEPKREELKKPEEPKREELKKPEEPKREEPRESAARREEPTPVSRREQPTDETPTQEEPRPKQVETVVDRENKLTEALSPSTFNRKIKQVKKLFPKKSMDEALQILEDGNTLENAYLDILDLSNRTFSKRIHIVRCQIGKLLADGGDFKAAVIIENSSILDSFTLCGENPSLFRDVFQLKNVEINGNVYWERCIFCKEFTISDCVIDTLIKMPAIVCEQGLSIVNSKIASLSAQRSQIRGQCLISGSTLECVAAWHKSSFYGPFLAASTNFQRAHFMDCFFKDKVEFARCIFEKSGNFGKITCEKGISFEGCVFNGVINMGEAYLKSESYFRRSEFVADATFNRLLISGSVVFEKATFSSLADFSGVNLGRSEFLQTTFHSDANFQEAIFTETTSMLECVFNQRAHFCRAVFLQKLDFRGCQFNHSVAFANVISDYIILERKQIENKLVAEKQKEYAIAEQEYLTFKQIFERQHNYEDRDWAHCHAKCAARKKVRFSLLHPLRNVQKIANWFFWDIGCGYGTRPGNIIWLSLFIIGICAALYGSLFAGHLGLPQDAVDKWPAAVWHSVISFIPGGIFFVSDDFVNANINLLMPPSWPDIAGNLWQFAPKALMLLENLLGLLLIFLFVFSLTRKLLQD